MEMLTIEVQTWSSDLHTPEPSLLSCYCLISLMNFSNFSFFLCLFLWLAIRHVTRQLYPLLAVKTQATNHPR